MHKVHKIMVLSFINAIDIVYNHPCYAMSCHVPDYNETNIYIVADGG